MDGVKLWMINNQLTHRNLTDHQRDLLAVARRGILGQQAKARQHAGTNQHSSLPQKSAEPSIETRKEVASYRWRVARHYQQDREDRGRRRGGHRRRVP
jgi:hypothetical protein